MEELAGPAAVEGEMARPELVKTPDRRPAQGAHSDSTGRAEAYRGGKKGGGAQYTHD